MHGRHCVHAKVPSCLSASDVVKKGGGQLRELLEPRAKCLVYRPSETPYIVSKVNVGSENWKQRERILVHSIDEALGCAHSHVERIGQLLTCGDVRKPMSLQSKSEEALSTVCHIIHGRTALMQVLGACGQREAAVNHSQFGELQAVRRRT